MNWYSGSIAEAVAKSKTKNAIFVVYVEGKDENSAKLSKFIDDPKIKDKLQSDDFVAIKIQSESEPYMQFASIYQIVPVPSIFFIGKTGTPLDVTTGVVASVEELEAKVLKVLELAGKSPNASTAAAMSQAFITQETKASTSAQSKSNETPSVEEKTKETKPEDKEIDTKSTEDTEIVCEGGVCYKKTKEGTTAEATPETADVKQSNDDDAAKKLEKEKEQKLAEARKILEQKRLERIEEEKRLEKERELQRRKEGKEVQNLRAWQRDQELKELKDSIKRDRLEEQAARERILAQIAADKAERAHKFANDGQASTSQAAAASAAQPNNPAPPTAASDETRLQFRFASGDAKTKNFKSSTTLSEIRDYVKNELLPGTGIKDFTLATSYPKREFTTEHYSKTMIDLELIPSAVILVIGKEATGPSAMIAKQGGLFNIFYMIVMSILNPVFSLFNTAKNWVTGNRNANNGAQATGAQKRANEERGGGVQDDIAKRRNLDRFVGGGNSVSDSGNGRNAGGDSSPTSSSQAYRRYVSGSNVHRLADNRKDSDDENATWNGNSTQQQ
ncbi:UBX domain-containing protein 4 [Musca autumnalis]|uniref:UBX domain-containing protein 4 n=1 Tax=Musca autumnalis TaxID=221902 RepID=UPI003CF63EEC